MRRVSPSALVATWTGRTRALLVELHLTPCVVTNPPGPHVDALVNPANERLAGKQFTPAECSRHLTAGTTLLYPPQVVDGLVHGMGGDSSGGDSSGATALAKALAAIPIVEGTDNVRCPTGAAVATKAYGELRHSFSTIIHAVAPFYDDDELARWRVLLRSTYRSALRVAAEARCEALALPLLGAGARGAPAAAAAMVAAEAMAEAGGQSASNGQAVVARIAVQDDDIAEVVAEAMDAMMIRT